MAVGPEKQTTTQPQAASGGDGQPDGSTLSGQDRLPPRLADGIQLLGRYEDSGFKEPPYMARRSDGQMIQMPPLLYAVAEDIDGRRGFPEIAQRVSEKLRKGVTADDVRYLVEKKLRPLGVIAGPDGQTPQVQRADPLLGLRMRVAVVPASVVRAVATMFHPLFITLVVVGVLVALAALDAWLFFGHGMAQSVRQILYQPLFLLMIFGLVVISAAFHEVGHATACRYGGAEPGVMGAGVYVVWPAFYTDVTDAYRLGKGGRLRTDLGGVYFNAIFILATAGFYFWTRFEPLLILIFVQHMEIIRQLLPVLRFDGYYVLSDLTGVPDLFYRVKPILASLIPWRRADDRAKQLKPWVRAVVTLWVLLIVPLLVFNIAMILIHAPRIVATAVDSLAALYGRVSNAFGAGKTARAAAGILQMATLSLPLAGMTYTTGRLGRRLAAGLWRQAGGRPFARTGATLLMLTAAAFVGMALWPDRDYRPIQPGERWTLTEGVEAITLTTQGRPAFRTVDDVGLGKEKRPAGGQPAPSLAPSETPSPTPSPTVGAVQATLSPVPTTTASPDLSPTPSPSPSPSPSPPASPSPQPSPTITP